MITFEQLPNSLRSSQIQVETGRIQQNKRAFLDQKVLLLGHYNSDAAPLFKVHQLSSISDAQSLFGTGSQLALMAEQAFSIDNLGSFYALPLTEAEGAVAATWQLTVEQPTSDGMLGIKVMDRMVSVVISSSMTLATLHRAIADAINGNINLPIKAVVSDGHVELTTKWAGASSNQVLIAIDNSMFDTVANVTVVVEQTTQGLVDPSLSAIMSEAIGDTWYTKIASPFNSSIAIKELADFASQRHLPSVKRTVMVFVGLTTSLTETLALAKGFNSPFITLVPIPHTATPSFLIASSASVVTAMSDATTPGRNYSYLILRGVEPSLDDNYLVNQAEMLETEGASVIDKNDQGLVVVRDLVTTYKALSNGMADEQWRPSEVVAIYQHKLNQIETMFKSDPFYRANIVDVTSKSTASHLVSINTVKAAFYRLFDEWDLSGLSKNIAGVKSSLQVELPSSSRFNIAFNDNFAVGLKVIAVKFNFTF